MAKTGIVIETEHNEVKETSLGVLTAAAGQEIMALVMDADILSVRDKLAEYGAGPVVSLGASSGDIAGSADLAARCLAEAVREYELDAVIGTASATGKDLFARLAAVMDLPMVSDCIAVDIDAKTVKKSHFSGKTIATLKLNTDVLIATIRPNAIEAVAAPCSAETLEFTAAVSDPGRLTVNTVKKGNHDNMDLTDAPVIVTGGRAVEAAENFKILEACAAKLGGAVGASRAAVDAGLASHTMQVGQTGKTVSPKLYIACGVSGAVQHFAGMKTSKVIVAINEGKDAPIFTKCDYGIVGSLFDVVPALTKKL